MHIDAPMPCWVWRPIVLASTLAVATACSTNELRELNAHFRASPTSLEFKEIAAGGRGRATITLHNTGRSDAMISFTSVPPFEAPAALDLLAGEQTEVEIAFAPTQAGAFDSTLQIESESGALPIALHGTAIDCQPTSACERSFASPDDGACVRTSSPDGTSCASACVANGVCVRGQCVGVSERCDDGDACTVDACAPAGGCVHNAVRCVEDDDPCTAAICDPSNGCDQVPVADGTACGAATCSRANVCLGGACMSVAAHEGSVCGLGSPCQDPGICHSGVCERPPARPLSADWSFSPEPGNSFRPTLAMDDDANLFFIESADIQDPGVLFGPQRVPSGWLVSLTSDGALRFRVPLHAPSVLESTNTFSSDWTPDHLLVDSDVVVLVGTSSIEVRSASTGARLWRDEVRRPLLPATDGVNATKTVASDGEHLFALFAGVSWTDDEWLLAYDLHSGALAWDEGFPRYSGLSVDSNDELVYSIDSEWLEQTVFEPWDRSGRRKIEPACPPLAGHADRIYAWGPEGLSILQTSCTAPFGLEPSSCYWTMGDRVRVGAGPTAFVIDPLERCGPDTNYPLRGFRISGVSDEDLLWQFERTTTDFTGDDFLTDRHGLLFSELRFGNGFEGVDLVEVDAWGDEVFSCPNDLGTTTLLGDERIYSLYPSRLSSASVPGVRIAPRGWSAENGGPGRTRRMDPGATRR